MAFTRKLRIVSLLPSATEIVCGLGFQDQLVGRSHECDFPPGVEQLPVCTSSSLNSERPSALIDRDVKTLLEKGLSLYQVNTDLLKALAPDVIVTQTQCEVCAVSESEMKKALEDWMGTRPTLVSLSAQTLQGVEDDIQRTANALEVPDQGRKARDAFRLRLNSVRERAAKQTTRPRVACIEWIDPLMAAGNWVPELVKIAGGINLFGKAGEHSPWMTWEDLRRADPDMVVIMPCGFSIERVRHEMPALERLDGWNQLNAVKSGNVHVVDGNQYFNRPGPRLADSAEILADLFIPTTAV